MSTALVRRQDFQELDDNRRLLDRWIHAMCSDAEGVHLVSFSPLGWITLAGVPECTETIIVAQIGGYRMNRHCYSPRELEEPLYPDGAYPEDHYAL